MTCCHDHDHGAEAIPVVLCLTNRNGIRLYWGENDPTEGPDYAHHRPRPEICSSTPTQTGKR